LPLINREDPTLRLAKLAIHQAGPSISIQKNPQNMMYRRQRNQAGRALTIAVRMTSGWNPKRSTNIIHLGDMMEVYFLSVQPLKQSLKREVIERETNFIGLLLRSQEERRASGAFEERKPNYFSKDWRARGFSHSLSSFT